jgi:hypothetical protein
MSKFTFTIDVEPDLDTNKYLSIEKGLKKAEALFDKHKIKPILFVTCDCIEKYPSIFKKLHEKGWEISLHGYKHQRFDDLSQKEAENAIKKSIQCFKKNLGIKPKGFRAPQHSIDNKTLDLLEKYGFEYDSSYYPLNLIQLFFFPKRFKSWIKHFFSKTRTYNIRKNLKERPTTSFIIPFTSLIIRILPIICLKLRIKLFSAMYSEVIFYCHSWDFIKLPKSKIDQKISHEKFIKKLDIILSYVSNR